MARRCRCAYCARRGWVGRRCEGCGAPVVEANPPFPPRDIGGLTAPKHPSRDTDPVVVVGGLPLALRRQIQIAVAVWSVVTLALVALAIWSESPC